MKKKRLQFIIRAGCCLALCLAVTPAGAVSISKGSQVTFTSGISNVESAAVAYGSTGNQFMAVWAEETTSTSRYDVKGRIVDINGTAVTGVLDIDINASVNSKTPVIAYSAKQNRYLVVYETLGAMVMLAMELWKPDGTLDTTNSVSGTNSSNYIFDASVAYNSYSDEFLLVWCDSNYNNTTMVDEYQIKAVTINAGTLALGSTVTIASGFGTGGDGYDRIRPRVVYNPDRNEYLVVYDRRKVPVPYGTIYCKVVPASLSGADGISEMQLGSTIYQESSVAAAGDDEYLVVWEDGTSNSLSHRSIYARRVSGDGSLPGSAFAVKDAANEAHYIPKVAYVDGAGYLIAWTHTNNATQTTVTLANVVAPGNDSVAGADFEIDANDPLGADVACSGSGTCLNVQDQSQSVDGWFMTVSGASSTTTTTPGTTGNTAPTASFTVSPAVGDTSTNFALEPFASSDAEDADPDLLVHIDWETDGTWDDMIAGDATATHTYASDGTYTITIEVEDTGGLTDQATQQVKVAAQASGNTDPVASFSVSPSSGDTSTTFSFDASGCSDAEDAASVLEVMWDFDGDGMFDTALSTVKTATHQYTSGGTYDVELVVVDTGGLHAVTTRQVVVSGGSTTTTVPATGGNTAPTAVAEANPPILPVGSDLELSSAKSSDAEDPIENLEFRWDFESDGSWDTEYTNDPFVLHVYQATGNYTATLEVVDTGGLTGQDTVTVMVIEEEGCPLGLVFAADDPRLEALQLLRDRVLANSRLGRVVTGMYYQNGKRLTDMLEQYPAIRSVAAAVLERLLPAFEKAVAATE